MYNTAHHSKQIYKNKLAFLEIAMKLGITLLTVTLIVLFTFVSGCANTSLGSAQVAEFGKSADAQKAQDWFISQYGNPATYTGSPRFLEPMVSSGVIDNTPTDKVLKFSKDTPSVYFWVIYEGFTKGDPVTATWTYQGKQYATLSKQVAGNYGAINARFDKPASGWALGTHTITISGGGAQNSVTFEIIAGSTVTAPLPYEMAPPVRIINQSGSGNKTSSGVSDPNIDDNHPVDPHMEPGASTNPDNNLPFNPDLQPREIKVEPSITPVNLARIVSRTDIVAPIVCGSSVCRSDQTCKDGTCVCTDGKTECGNQCLDLTTDAKNCGSCGWTCTTKSPYFTSDKTWGEITMVGLCNHGKCYCPMGGQICDNKCVSLQNDPYNCGSCGTRCPVFGSGQMKCVEGTCSG